MDVTKILRESISFTAHVPGLSELVLFEIVVLFEYWAHFHEGNNTALRNAQFNTHVRHFTNIIYINNGPTYWKLETVKAYQGRSK